MKVLNIVLLVSLITISTQANERRGKRGGRRGPPQEAITACSDKQESDSCSFEGRRGEVSGTCNSKNEVLSCRPDNHGERK